MSDWKAGFKRAMIKVLIDRGSPISDTASFYGWQDYHDEWRHPHPKRLMVERKGVDFEATTYTESCWDEFMGTFYEGDTRVYGVDIDLVLLDGTRLKWRYAGNVSALITSVLEADS